MTFKPMQDWEKSFMGGDIHACPLRGHWTSFQLVDEFGDGKPYAGLTYKVTDYEDIVYTGKLDATGSGKVDNHYCGPVVLTLDERYKGGADPWYEKISDRKNYPLPITKLQVRAEKTWFFNKTGVRTQHNPAQDKADTYYQVEVSELVEHIAHLPPLAERQFAPNPHVLSLMRHQTEEAMGVLGFGPKLPKRFGLGLLPNKHHVLEVRPLRALRPMLSTGNDFCALNLYQLALMATLSYSDFGQAPNSQPVEADRVKFPLQPSVGNWFGHALAQGDELWQVDIVQAGGKAYYPLYEEVPYSKRLEVVPFDPELYPEVNAPSLGQDQEHPAKIHFFDDANNPEGTDTQALITHHDELILISVRGTASMADVIRDLDAKQVPFEEGSGKVHNGFYGAAKALRGFIANYLDKFYSGQKLVITGHSLGGAIALILSEMLRRRDGFTYDILLYTYGSPRAGDQTFVDEAADLVHHRMVNHNDPVPSVPTPWMNTSKPIYLTGLAVATLHTPVGVMLFALGLGNFAGEPYEHHGQLRHFMRVVFERNQVSSILWEPGCSTMSDTGCARVLQQLNGLPVRGGLIRQIVDSVDHKMVDSYIPNCWATLRRWQESLEINRSLVTVREFDWVDTALESIQTQLRDGDREWTMPARREAQEQALRALSTEKGNILQTRHRLVKLRSTRASEADVYGLAAAEPEELARSLERWRAHTENNALEQLAMAPPEVYSDQQVLAAILGGYEPGAPYHLDIDSLG